MSLTTLVGCYGARGLTALAALLAVSVHMNGATTSQTVGAERNSAAPAAPEIIWHPQNMRATHGTPVGLLYTPDTLAALVARQAPDRVSPRLSEAARQRTPIVLMWSIPPSTDFGEAPRPFKVAITDPH